MPLRGQRNTFFTFKVTTWYKKSKSLSDVTSLAHGVKLQSKSPENATNAFWFAGGIPYSSSLPSPKNRSSQTPSSWRLTHLSGINSFRSWKSIGVMMSCQDGNCYLSTGTICCSTNNCLLRWQEIVSIPSLIGILWTGYEWQSFCCFLLLVAGLFLTFERGKWKYYNKVERTPA